MRVRLTLAVGALGCSCVMVQLALLREALCAFSGNEMVLGVVLGLWMLLMGCGAALGRLATERDRARLVFERLLVLAALLPPAQLFGLRALRNVIFLRGAAVGLSETLAAGLALLLPYCLTAGCALTLGCFLLLREQGVGGIGRGYLADSAGGIAGGVLFSFWLVRWFDHIALMVFPAAVCLVAAGLLGAERRRRATLVLAAAVGLALIASVALVHPDRLSTAFEFPGQRVLEVARSPYGRLVVTEFGGQLNFVENGVVVALSHDPQRVEETVHYAMAQRPAAARVLLVGGGISGTAREILKYPVARIDYVELDPLLPGLGKKYSPGSLADARIHIINTDGRLFIRRRSVETEKYDVVILDVPPPSTAQLNRFYTAEFLAEVKRVLAPEGVVSFALGQYENYMGPGLAGMLASAHSSLALSFRHQLAIPGGHVFFLGSDGPLSLDIAAILERNHIATALVNHHYLDAMLMPDRMADLARALASVAPPNRDLAPVLYYYHLRHWISQFEVRFGFWHWALTLGLVFYLARLRGAARVLFASGFAGSALEVVLLLALQIFCGSVYHQVAVIVTVFMLGLLVGAGAAERAARRREEPGPEPRPQLGHPGGPGGHILGGPVSRERTVLLALGLGLAGLSASLPFLLQALDRLASLHGSEGIVKGTLALLTFLVAALAGAQFPLANRLEFDGAASGVSRLYAADFVGACLGALLAGTLLVPLIGIGGLCAACAALNLLAALSWRRIFPFQFSLGLPLVR